MGTAAEIKALRLNSTRSEQELADLLGITIHGYGDLEAYDDELFTCLSVDGAQRLMRALGTDLASFVGCEEPASSHPLQEAPAALLGVAKKKGWSLDELSDEVGWELDDFLQSPEHTARERSLDFLRDVAAVLALDWRKLLPPEAAREGGSRDAV